MGQVKSMKLMETNLVGVHGGSLALNRFKGGSKVWMVVGAVPGTQQEAPVLIFAASCCLLQKAGKDAAASGA